MGDLLLHTESFVFPEADQNEAKLNNFLLAGKHAGANGDYTHAPATLGLHKFKWGNFYVDFAYANFEAIKANSGLNWIPQILHQALQSFFYANPSGKSQFSDCHNFKTEMADKLHGLLGCECAFNPEDEFVHDVNSWHIWKASYLAQNPDKIEWKDSTDLFLPNKLHSNELLKKEVEKHAVEESKKVEHGGSIPLIFHNEVMKKKGPDLNAYTVEIGTKIAEANYFKLEEELSKAEKNAAGADRTIFSSLNKDRKKIFISLDTAHGMFEYHDETGKHLGEYKFDGSFNSGAEVSHNLKTL